MSSVGTRVAELLQQKVTANRAEATATLRLAVTRAATGGDPPSGEELSELVEAMRSLGVTPAEFDGFVADFTKHAAMKATVADHPARVATIEAGIKRANAIKEQIEQLKAEERSLRARVDPGFMVMASERRSLDELVGKARWLFNESALYPQPSGIPAHVTPAPIPMIGL